MISAELPDNEEMRLLDLSTYNLQNPDTEIEFNQLSELLTQYFNCPIALVTIIDSDRQWFKGKIGTTETGNSRELSFCSHTLLENDVLVVEDATKDERFFDNPFVAGEFNIRFYAGAPIVSTEGYKLGTICLYDIKPKKLSASKKKALGLFSKQVTKLLELKKNNILLYQRAQEIITLKTEIFTRFIQRQEEDKKEIAFNLHEDFAQGIAASLMILQIAKPTNKESAALVSKAIQQLKEILANIRKLSYSIVPQVIDWVATDHLILQFVNSISSAYPFKLTVENTGNVEVGSKENAICAIRIIEQWLKVLLKFKTVNNVNISISYEKQFILSIEDDGSKENLINRKKEVFESIVYDRANAEGGTVELSVSSTGKNVLTVLLPFTKAATLNITET